MIASGGNHEAGLASRLTWAAAMGLLAAALLWAGGLSALQTAAIVTGLPFAVILLIMCYSLYKGLKEDYLKLEKKKSEKQMDDYEEVVKEIVARRNKKD